MTVTPRAILAIVVLVLAILGAVGVVPQAGLLVWVCLGLLAVALLF